MARIAGVNIPLNKRIEIGLTSIFGVGRSRSNEVLGKTGISPDTYVKDLTDDEIIKLREAIDNNRLKTLIEIDGGISEKTIAEAAEAGCDAYVAGSAVYGKDDPAAAVDNLRRLDTI